jgi:hypothetical protein
MKTPDAVVLVEILDSGISGNKTQLSRWCFLLQVVHMHVLIESPRKHFYRAVYYYEKNVVCIDLMI